MYLPAHFQETRLDVLHDFIRANPFGLLVTPGVPVPVADGLPFLIEPDGAGGLGTLRGHVARANPLWQNASADVLVVFQGPHAYVSPSWYASKAEHGKVVPTWNYLMAQATGRLRAIDDPAWVLPLVTRLTGAHEARQASPWAVDDAPAAFVETMLRAIVGIEIELTALVGKWKVGQNRPAADRTSLIRALEERGDDTSRALAAQTAQPGAS
jgi:transcriptional regulator